MPENADATRVQEASTRAASSDAGGRTRAARALLREPTPSSGTNPERTQSWDWGEAAQTRKTDVRGAYGGSLLNSPTPWARALRRFLRPPCGCTVLVRVRVGMPLVLAMLARTRLNAQAAPCKPLTRLLARSAGSHVLYKKKRDIA